MERGGNSHQREKQTGQRWSPGDKAQLIEKTKERKHQVKQLKGIVSDPKILAQGTA